MFTVGFPDSFEKYVTYGVVSNRVDGWTYSDTVMDHGSSGGGLFDASGGLVGLADSMHYPNANVYTYQGFSMFTDIDAMRDLVEKYEGF